MFTTLAVVAGVLAHDAYCYATFEPSPEEAQESCGWFVMKLSSPATGPLDGD